jgi:N-acetylglucosaminyl-diphospho-decaprenol L-rhamnosyltransferase
MHILNISNYNSQVCISIVSHGHGSMVGLLVERLLAFAEVGQIIVTLNVYESISIPNDRRVLLISNQIPKGFGENHNTAFSKCHMNYFCPLNPDIEFIENPFPILLPILINNDAALVAPRIIAPDGSTEDSWRYFPTFLSLLKKLFFNNEGRIHEYISAERNYTEWVAGMFMLFQANIFNILGGFDCRFFLYYEDVDICARIWKSNNKILVCPTVSVIHDARRDSRKKIKHLYWHICSLILYLIKYRGGAKSIIHSD